MKIFGSEGLGSVARCLGSRLRFASAGTAQRTVPPTAQDAAVRSLGLSDGGDVAVAVENVLSAIGATGVKVLVVVHQPGFLSGHFQTGDDPG